MGWSVLTEGTIYEGADVEKDPEGLLSPMGSQVLMRITLASVIGRRVLPAELIWPVEGYGYL